MSEGGHLVRTVAVDALRRYMRAMLRAAGCDEENAGVAAEGFLAAAARRHALDTGRVTVYESVWTRMEAIAAGLGVEVPETETPAPFSLSR